MFGMYLLSVTFLAALLTTLLSLVTSDTLRWKVEQVLHAMPQSWPGTLSLYAVCATLLAFPYIVTKFWSPFVRLLSRLSRLLGRSRKG
jgi:hypothetical protein